MSGDAVGGDDASAAGRGGEKPDQQHDRSTL